MSNYHGTPRDQGFEFIMTPPNNTPIDELRQAKKEIELLKTTDPFRVVEMAIELQVERMKVAEAISARDAVVQRLSDAYASIRQKTAALEHFQQHETSQNLGPPSLLPFVPESSVGLAEKQKLTEDVIMLESIIKNLRGEIKYLKEASPKSPDPPPCYEEGMPSSMENDICHGNVATHSRLVRTETSRIPFRVLREPPPSVSRTPSQNSALSTRNDGRDNSRLIIDEPNDLDYRVVRLGPKSGEPEDMIKARNAILAALPLPVEVPDDILKPIIIPAPFTLHEFLGNASGSLRTSLSNYRLLQQITTSWCPEREEHGYFLTPVFKCSTNPRVATAHRWSAVDIVARMSKPTECFYNKDGIWYYAGVYKGFRLEDLTTKEWEVLSTEATQAIIKDTISGRKNTSPQNVYETSQLYAAGALKVACVGLQCVGFNKLMYEAILEQASKCAQNGKWKGGTSPTISPGQINAAGSVLGTGSAWNVNANTAGAVDVIDGMVSMGLDNRNGEGAENAPVKGDVRAKR